MSQQVEKLAIKLGQILKNKSWKIATAESCTGGGLAYYITNIPHSSEWFERGFVTYSNLAKEELLGVRAETLATFGAVSEQTACEMAEGALKNSSAQISIAITGIAGPTGGSPDKPVGTVWLAWAGVEMKTQASLYLFSGDRHSIREQSILTAFEKTIAFL